MKNDFCVDVYYDLLASDFLSEEEIADLTAPLPLLDDDNEFSAVHIVDYSLLPF